MSGSKIAFWLLVLAILGGAVWYRSTVFSEPVVVERPSVAFVTGGSGPYWQLAVNGAKAAAKAHNVDLDVKLLSISENLQEQTEILTKLPYEKLDGVAFSPIDGDAQTRLINRMARDLYVITYDSDAPLSERRCHIGTSNFAAGQLSAKLISEALPEGGKVAVLQASLTKSSNIERKLGVEETLGISSDGGDADASAADSKIVIVNFLVDDGDDKKCARLIRETLKEHGDLAGFIGMNARHGPILLKVLTEDGQLAKMKLVTFDDAAETLAGVEGGQIFATVAQDPYMYGYEAVRMLASLARGDPSDVPVVGGGTIHVNAEAIRQENLAKFRERVDKRLPEQKQPAA